MPYWLMCSAWVLLSFSMASMMCFMPPGFLMDSVEKLVWAPVPACIHSVRHTVMLHGCHMPAKRFHLLQL